MPAVLNILAMRVIIPAPLMVRVDAAFLGAVSMLGTNRLGLFRLVITLAMGSGAVMIVAHVD